jgi:hypothetical protein
MPPWVAVKRTVTVAVTRARWRASAELVGEDRPARRVAERHVHGGVPGAGELVGPVSIDGPVRSVEVGVRPCDHVLGAGVRAPRSARLHVVVVRVHRRPAAVGAHGAEDVARPARGVADAQPRELRSGRRRRDPNVGQRARPVVCDLGHGRPVWGGRLHVPAPDREDRARAPRAQRREPRLRLTPSAGDANRAQRGRFLSASSSPAQNSSLSADADHDSTLLGVDRIRRKRG